MSGCLDRTSCLVERYSPRVSVEELGTVAGLARKLAGDSRGRVLQQAGGPYERVPEALRINGDDRLKEHCLG